MFFLKLRLFMRILLQNKYKKTRKLIKNANSRRTQKTIKKIDRSCKTLELNTEKSVLIQRKIPQNIQNSWLESEGYRFRRVQQFK